MSDVLTVVTLLVALAAAAAALMTLREVRRLHGTISDRSQEADGTGRRDHRGAPPHRSPRAPTHPGDRRRPVLAVRAGADGATMPSTQGWAASPMVLRQLAEQVTQHQPDLVVELGGGGSSVLLGRLLTMQGHGRVVSIDHDPDVRRAHA